MSRIILDRATQIDPWIIGIAESHNADHDVIDHLIGIMGITQPQLVELELSSLDENFFKLRQEREALQLLLSTGLLKLTMNELKLIGRKVWKLTQPDQVHFRTFMPDQVHAHPGLETLSKQSWQQFTRRTARLLYSSDFYPIDQLAHTLGEGIIFQYARKIIKNFN